MSAPLPLNEEERLKALQRYEVLDTAPEQEFDDITLLASHICGTPIAMISLVDENRQWFKSRVGMTATETSRDVAFCAHGILQSDMFIVEDALADERFSSNPLVTGNPKIRFYAGAPLMTPEGHALGMLCVNDRVPRELSVDQQAALRALSRQVVAQLELRRALTQVRRTNAQLKTTEESLRDSETKFHQLAENITDVFWITAPDFHKIYYVSPGYELIWGRSMESLYARPHQWVEAILPEERERVFAIFSTLGTSVPEVSVEYRIARPDGTIRWVHDRGFEVRDADGNVVRLTGIATDITERKQVEEHLFQSQKMETVGKLAGGIAHEFNSIMTAIIGQSEMMLSDLSAENPLSRRAQQIRQAGERAATLTRQLLAYGRKQMLQPEILDLNKVLKDLENILLHVVGQDAEIHMALAAGPAVVKVDAGQIEQVIMNMAMNAVDAMPDGGRLALGTTRATLDKENVKQYPELTAGDYVMLTITDTGVGMTDEVKAHLFEPFFTTKEVGEGTGLGLATCHGIVKQSGGHIAVDSELGKGTTFKVYLPQVQTADVAVPRRDASSLPCGTETVLLVEDDPALREMAATLLGRLGYKTLTAENGVEALVLTQRPSTGPIDLLFTDIVMPQMSGKELSDRIHASHPKTKIIFTSPYTIQTNVQRGMLDESAVLLQKPFTPSGLALKVREVLDDRS